MSNEKVSAAGSLAALFDAGTFAELGAQVSRDAGNEPAGVVCGYGAVEGRLVYAFAQDYSRMKGAVDGAQIRKIRNIYELAEKNGAPVVGVFTSAGGTVLEGTALLDAYGELFAASARVSGVVPQIAVIQGVCIGSLAVFAQNADFVITAGKESVLSFAPLSVLKASGLKDAEAADKTAAAKGAVAISCENIDSAMKAAKDLLTKLPSNYEEKIELACPDINRDAVISESSTIDEILAQLLDAGSMTELYPEYGKDIITAIATINGKPTGIVAPRDAVTANGLDKAARIVKFCDAFSLPLLYVVDSEGFDAKDEAEGADIARVAGTFAAETANATVPKVALITGKAYGAVFTLFASKTAAADITYALPFATVSVMPPESAVEFLKDELIAAAPNPNQKRAELIAEWKANEASPDFAAAQGLVDAVVESSETIKKVASAFEMLDNKRDFGVPKKHISK